MQIAVVGAGRIGTTFAFHLAQAGHEVTLIARGKRLEELQRNPVIETDKGKRAEVKVAASLDPAIAFDRVLVTVLAHQVDDVLPALRASAAKNVIFMFNTFERLDRLREAVGPSRFTAGFPTVVAYLTDGKLRSSVSGPGQITTVGNAEWAELFTKAGIPTEVQPDMESFLRSHAVFVIPLMAIGSVVFQRKAGISWGEAWKHARATKQGFAVVRKLGHSVIPAMVSTIAFLPSFCVAFMYWVLSRTAVLRDLGSMGPGEVRALIDAMAQAAPGETGELTAIRP
jgi:2-dehydropantoate 2-reductase